MAQNNLNVFILKSPDFKGKGSIPQKFTCDGQDISPRLTWEDIPAGAQSLALIVDDPDAPRDQPFVHWIIYNIPVDQNELEENIPPQKELSFGASQGYNDFNKIGYGGPCPPKGHGIHNYHFKLYALNKKLDLGAGATKVDLRIAMEGHVIDSTQLIGLYQRD